MTSKRSWRETKLELEDELAIEITLRLAINQAAVSYTHLTLPTKA